MGVLQTFISEQTPLELASKSELVNNPDLPKSSEADFFKQDFSPQSNSMASPSRLSPPSVRLSQPVRLSPIRPELSRVDSTGSEDEIGSGFSWRQGNPQRSGETDKKKG